MSIEKILIVDDELLVRSFLSETLRRTGVTVTCAEDGAKGVALLKKESFDMVITDMKMPEVTGLELLKIGRQLQPDALFIVITAFGSIEDAVEAMRLGAFHYLVKPFSPDTIEAIIEKANGHQQLVEENRYLKQESLRTQPTSVIAESPAMRQVMEQVAQAAKSQASILITGESGTGKEVVASAIHALSTRKEGPFIKINCAAIPDTLIESELLGHEKGAFTGADARRLGRFELAHKGTLLLDEVTEIPLGLQAKLLRVLQEREFERLGGVKTIKTDVRVISTTNRSLQEAIASHHLREDLYYRLNVVPIHLPPLRERKEDLLPLARAFLSKSCSENGTSVKKLSKSAEEALLAYSFPGNVRELSNIIERAAIMSPSPEIAAEQLCLGVLTPPPTTTNTSLPVGMITLAELEKRFIIETLLACNQNEKIAAEKLGITLRNLRTKCKASNTT